MDKLYPPVINGTLPAFYDYENPDIYFHNLSEFKNNNNTFKPPDDSYFITCDNTNGENFGVSPDAQLQLVENKKDLYCYNGLVIDKSNLTGFQQLAIVKKTSDSENNNKFELKFIINYSHPQWDRLINRKLKIYFTTDINYLTSSEYSESGWIKTQGNNTNYIHVGTISSADITIPYKHNRSVSLDNIKGFALKLKKIQTNTEICVLRASKENQADINHQINFIIPPEDLGKIYPGEFLKAQLAYLYGEDDDIGKLNIGYYSTVGIIKYINPLSIDIKEFKSGNNNNDNIFYTEYHGWCDLTNLTTKPYQQKFSLYLNDENLKETSDWFLYNFEQEEKNAYHFQTCLLPQDNLPINYTIEYSIKTIDNAEFSKSYEKVFQLSPMNDLKIKLIAKNIFDDGYINLFFKEDGWQFDSSSYVNYTNNIYHNVEIDSNDKLNISENKDYKNLKHLEINNQQLSLTKNTDNNKYYYDTIISNQSLKLLKQFLFPEKNAQIKIYRADATHSFMNWTQIATIKNISSYSNIFSWSFKDFSIEQGEEYQYICIFDNSLISNKTIATADFEDAFLYDGKKQIKIRFNPKISSFKINRLEQKIETIGSQFPFIFRNNTVEYKEFPISGLISYLMDDNQFFMKYNDLGLELDQKRWDSPDFALKENIPTTNLTGYNIKAERLFKLELLKWLGNGEIKLFKSPAEGNYFVCLMNISLAPEDRLNRMLHTFSCIAYEVQEYNSNNLLKLGFFNKEE